MEVRREDQDKINKFSRLHQREMQLEEDLKTKAVCKPSITGFKKETSLNLRAERQRGP